MIQSTKPISPLRQRMMEDMTLRKFTLKTQSDYIRSVVNFTRFLGRSPDTAEADDLRRYQLRLVEQGVSSFSMNGIISALRFFFEFTVDRPQVMKRMFRIHQPRKIPEILSPEEVSRLLRGAVSLNFGRRSR